MKTENLTYSLSNKTSFKKNAQEIKKRENEDSLGAESRMSTSAHTAKKYDRIELNKQDIKATAGKNPSGRLSFKGKKEIAEMTVEQLSKTFGGKLATNKFFNKFLDTLSGNSLVAEALFALGLTSILRPASIYAIPAKDKEIKKKNNYQVAHSISTGLLGLGTTFVASEPIKRAVKKVMDNPKKFHVRDAAYIKANERVFKETAGRLHQPIFLPLRAMLTIMVVPPLLRMFGMSKKSNNLTPTDKAKIDYSFMSFKGADKKMFKNFASINSSFDKAERNLKKESASKSKPSFKGVPLQKLGKTAVKAFDKTGNVITDTLAHGIGRIADTKGFKGFIEWFQEKKQWFPHLIAGESLLLSGFYMQQTGKSKTIEKDQKLPMILNQGITAILCTIGAYKVDGYVNKKLEVYKEVYQKMNPHLNAQDMKTKLTGIRLLGPIIIFATIYRFIGPVVVTPFANWLSEKIQPHKKPQKLK